MQNGKYRKIEIRKAGGPEVLQITEDVLTEPEAGEVILQNLAAGVAFADILMREGVYPGMPDFPFTPGYDVVGRVVKTGSAVSGISTGKKYAALTVHGSYAEYMKVDAKELVAVPASVADADAVSCVLNYTTAYQMIHRMAGLKKGDAVLIFGAAGGVGTALLQLGKTLGLEMYGTASPEKKQTVEEYAHWIDYKNLDPEQEVRRLCPQGLAAVFDGTAEWLAPSWRLLRNDGKLIVFGASSMLKRGRKSFINKLKTIFRFRVFLGNFFPGKKHASFYSITTMKKKQPAWFVEDLITVFAMLEEGRIHPLIEEEGGLVDIQRFHEILNSGKNSGKLVLRFA